jgi:hypothetical protein
VYVLRKTLEEFKQLLIDENKLEGHEQIFLAFDHLLDAIETHEALHRSDVGRRLADSDRPNGEVEEAIRVEDLFFRHAIYTVIRQTTLDLIHQGQKDWQKFYDRVE